MKRMKKSFCKRLIIIITFIFLSIQTMGFSSAEEFQNNNKVEELNCEEFNASIQVDAHKFYYNQLNDVEKEIYNAFYISKDLIISNKSFICVSGKVEKYSDYVYFIQRAFYAYVYDNPDAGVYLDIACFIAIKSEKYGNQYYDYVIKPNRNTNCYTKSNSSPDETISKLETLESTTREFVNTLSGSDTEKLTQIHNWLIENASYDKTYSLPNTNNAYGAIIQKQCVCGGYASAFKYVADMAGLDVIFVTGYVISYEKTSEFHAWNYAYVDGKWLLVDVTWDIGLNSTIYLLMDPNDEENLKSSHMCKNKRFVYPY